jgi:hypothetical protein
MSGPRLTPTQLEALKDAHMSRHYGGMRELPSADHQTTEWQGFHPKCTTLQSNPTMHFLFTEGLISRIGLQQERFAQITEQGLMQLDLEGFGND